MWDWDDAPDRDPALMWLAALAVVLLFAGVCTFFVWLALDAFI